MANSLLMAYGESANAVIGSTSTQFLTFCSDLLCTGHFTFAETSQQVEFTAAGIMSNLWCRVKTGTTSGSSTLTFRKNAADTTQTISIAQAGTGAFADISGHTTSIAAADLLGVKVVAGDTNLLLTIVAVTFAATTDTATHIGNIGYNNVSSTPITIFATPSGFSNQTSGSEANAKLRIRKPFTVKNLCVNNIGGSSSGGSANSITSRKNGLTGNLTVSFTDLLLHMDTTHSDSLATGDDYDFTVVCNNTILAITSAEFISTVGDAILSCSSDTGTTLTTSNTKYAGLSGGLETLDLTEENTKVTVNSTFQFSELTVNVIANTLSNSSTVKLRVNGGDSGLVVSIPLNTTGVTSDSSNLYTAATTDAMNYQIVTSSTGTSMIITQISVYANATAAAPAGGPMYQHFDNTTQSNRQNINNFGGNLVIFG